ncbi:MAG TPA: hypothetical protein VGE39_25390 [Prosthecobacter sp.]
MGEGFGHALVFHRRWRWRLGYLWWTSKDGSFSARGAGGHCILVIPRRDLVIVRRVNTDISGRGVESSEFGGLVRRILAAQASE